MVEIGLLIEVVGCGDFDGWLSLLVDSSKLSLSCSCLMVFRSSATVLVMGAGVGKVALLQWPICVTLVFGGCC